MRYVVIEGFSDMMDGGREYKPRDKFPVFDGLADEQRLNSLASSFNKLGRPLIKAVPQARVEKPEKEAAVDKVVAEEKPVKKESNKKATRTRKKIEK